MKGNSEKVHFSSNHDGATLFLLEPCTIYIIAESQSRRTILHFFLAMLLHSGEEKPFGI
jgi:hypothetical protein